MSDTALAIALALASTLGYGASFVLTQFGLQRIPPWLGAAFSAPTATLLFWCMAPFAIDTTTMDFDVIALFAGIEQIEREADGKNRGKAGKRPGDIGAHQPIGFEIKERHGGREAHSPRSPAASC